MSIPTLPSLHSSDFNDSTGIAPVRPKISIITDSSKGSNSTLSTDSAINSFLNPKCRKDSLLKRIALRSKTNIWEKSCFEVDEELKHLDSVLSHVGLPVYNYSKAKSFPFEHYLTAPDIKTCTSKDYLDYYILPHVLPAIQSLIIFLREKRIFQCRVTTFNPMDYLSEYLYNNNDYFHPERIDDATPLFETKFAKAWLEKYPRPPSPKWLSLSKEAATLKIQRLFRGYLVRKRPDVQEVRQFWADLKKDELQELQKPQTPIIEPEPILVLDDEISEEHESIESSDSEVKTHSDDCFPCKTFKASMTESQRQLKVHIKLNENEETEDTEEREKIDKKNTQPSSVTKEIYTKNYENCCFNTNEHLPFTMEAKRRQGALRQIACLSTSMISNSKKSLPRTVVISQTDLQRTSFSLDSFVTKKFRSLNIEVPIMSRAISGMDMVRRSADSKN